MNNKLIGIMGKGKPSHDKIIVGKIEALDRLQLGLQQQGVPCERVIVHSEMGSRPGVKLPQAAYDRLLGRDEDEPNAWLRMEQENPDATIFF